MNKRDLTRSQVADIISRFLDGTGGDWDWEDFTSGYSLSDKRLEEIRIRSMTLPAEFPPTTPREYTNEEGRAVLVELVRELRRKPRDRGDAP
jgi:hypothetical protein